MKVKLNTEANRRNINNNIDFTKYKRTLQSRPEVFSYLGTEINRNNKVTTEIASRTQNNSRYYYGSEKLMEFKLIV